MAEQAAVETTDYDIAVFVNDQRYGWQQGNVFTSINGYLINTRICQSGNFDTVAASFSIDFHLGDAVGFYNCAFAVIAQYLGNFDRVRGRHRKNQFIIVRSSVDNQNIVPIATRQANRLIAINCPQKPVGKITGFFVSNRFINRSGNSPAYNVISRSRINDVSATTSINVIAVVFTENHIRIRSTAYSIGARATIDSCSARSIVNDVIATVFST